MNYNFMNEKKKKSVLPLVLVLLVVLIGIIAFGVMEVNKLDNSDTYDKVKKKSDNTEKTDKDDNNEDEDVVEEERPEKNGSYTFVGDKISKVKFNDKEIEILAYYYIDSYPIENFVIVDGSETDYYVLRRDIFINGVQIEDTMAIGQYFNKNGADDAIRSDDISEYDKLNDSVNENQYLIMYFNNLTYISDVNTSDNIVKKIALIVNDEGVVLKEIILEDRNFKVAGVLISEYMLKDRHYINTENIKSCTNINLEEVEKYVLYPDGKIIDIHEKFIYYVTGNENELKEYMLVVADGKIKEEESAKFLKEQILINGQC